MECWMHDMLDGDQIAVAVDNWEAIEQQIASTGIDGVFEISKWVGNLLQATGEYRKVNWRSLRGIANGVKKLQYVILKLSPPAIDDVGQLDDRPL